MDLKEIEILYNNLSASFELRHEKTGFFHMRNQSRRSASRLDQLRGNREADQRLCFRYIASTIPLLPKSEISSLYTYTVAVQPDLYRTRSETRKTGFLATRLIWCYSVN